MGRILAILDKSPHAIQLKLKLKNIPVFTMLNTLCFLSLRISDAKGLLSAKGGDRVDVAGHLPSLRRTDILLVQS